MFENRNVGGKNILINIFNKIADAAIIGAPNKN